MTDRDRRDPDPTTDPAMTRRNLIRRAGMLGVGALGASVLGCKGRPEEALVDLSTEPSLIQAGGTVSGFATGLLGGAAAADVVFRLIGYGSVTTGRDGSFAIRVDRPGEFEVEVDGPGFVERTSRLLVTGSTAVSVELLERDSGMPIAFLSEYARGTGPGDKAGVVSRTPGRTSRWAGGPRVVIYRRLEDDDKDVIPDARLTAMQASILALFGPLTGNTLAFGGVEVRNAPPPRRVDRVDVGTIAIAQRKDNLLGAEWVGSTSSPFAIVKSRITNGVGSSIELFNRMFAHALGAQVVSGGFDSILNPAGRATPSDRDLLAATFLYGRVPGNRAPDADPAGVFLNA